MQYQPYSTIRKPGKVEAIAIMTLVNGILNILWGIGATFGVVLGTLFFGTLCAPLTLAPAVLGVFEIIYASKLMSTNPQPPLKPSMAIAVCEICCVLVGNVVSLVVGILAVVFYSDQEVKYYYDQINAGASVVVPPASQTPPAPPASSASSEQTIPDQPVTPPAPEA